MIDFHLHSTASDGTLQPMEVVKRAYNKGLKAIALTDHDTIDGLREAATAASGFGIEFINGIEFSTDYYGKEVHILGFFINPDDEIFAERLKKLKEERDERTLLMLEKLRQYKIDISLEDVMKEVTGEIISRMHISNVLVKKGFCKDRREAFSIYIGDSGVAYIPKKNLLPVDAVRYIKENGGLAFVAHPKLIHLGQEKVLSLIDELKKAGLDGIEAYYPSFTDIDTAYYKRIAGEKGLMLCGGSDFHGNNREGVEIGGTMVPDELCEIMKTKL